MTSLPKLTGTPEAKARAYELRRATLKRAPVLRDLMWKFGLDDAHWWIANSRRLQHPRVWVRMCSTLEEQNDLREALSRTAELEF